MTCGELLIDQCHIQTTDTALLMLLGIGVAIGCALSAIYHELRKEPK